MVHCAQKAMLSWDQTWALRPTCVERRELFHSSCLRLCWSHDFRLAFRTPPSLLPQRWKGHWHHCSAPSALTQCWASRGEKKKDHGNDDVSEIIRRIDLCAAITGTIVDRNPLCQAYFTSCTTASLYIVSIEPNFVEICSPCRWRLCETNRGTQDEDKCLCIIL